MSYHHCPIEPSDWSDGPDDEPECPECCGDGIEDEITRAACTRCGGLGYLEKDDFYDPAEWHDPEDKS